MKRIALKISGLALLGIMAMSCDKYEAGPDVTLIPRKDRVANTWVVEEATENGEDVTDNYDQYELFTTRDGDANLEANYTAFGSTFSTDTDGTWEFQNDDENISFDYEDDDQDRIYQILKLTSDEMWLREIGQDLVLKLEEK